MSRHKRRGLANNLYVVFFGSAAVLVVLVYLIFQGAKRRETGVEGELFLFCAAGVRYPIDEIVKDYLEECGVDVQVQYEGSNTLLSKLKIGKTGDLYLAADDQYMQQAADEGLVDEVVSLARQTPVIVVSEGNPKQIETIADLLRGDVKVACGNPEAAAIGKIVRELLLSSGDWEDLKRHVEDHGVFKPTVNDIASDVKLGSVDAGLVWDSTAAQYAELEIVRTAELEKGKALIQIGVLRSTNSPPRALRFARFVSARDRGLQRFEEMSFDPVEGDKWSPNPELTFYAGSVNRRALEPIIKAFEQREGVTVDTIYNGCGILTAQMRVLQNSQESGFPDVYMACDKYYLETVKEMFQEGVEVSDTDIVIAVAKGNPKNILTPEDFLRDDVRVVLGQPDQCTIGVLSRRLLEDVGVYNRLTKLKDVPMKASSAQLVPDVEIGAADAALAYVSDTKAAADKIDAVRIQGSELAVAVQPFSIARSSELKELGRRLFRTITNSRDQFESKGFHWRLDEVPEQSEVPEQAEVPEQSEVPATNETSEEEETSG